MKNANFKFWHVYSFCSGRVKFHDFLRAMRLKTCKLSEEVSQYEIVIPNVWIMIYFILSPDCILHNTKWLRGDVLPGMNNCL